MPRCEQAAWPPFSGFSASPWRKCPVLATAWWAGPNMCCALGGAAGVVLGPRPFVRGIRVACGDEAWAEVRGLFFPRTWVATRRALITDRLTPAPRQPAPTQYHALARAAGGLCPVCDDIVHRLRLMVADCMLNGMPHSVDPSIRGGDEWKARAVAIGGGAAGSAGEEAWGGTESLQVGATPGCACEPSREPWKRDGPCNLTGALPCRFRAGVAPTPHNVRGVFINSPPCTPAPATRPPGLLRALQRQHPGRPGGRRHVHRVHGAARAANGVAGHPFLRAAGARAAGRRHA